MSHVKVSFSPSPPNLSVFPPRFSTTNTGTVFFFNFLGKNLRSFKSWPAVLFTETFPVVGRSFFFCPPKNGGITRYNNGITTVFPNSSIQATRFWPASTPYKNRILLTRCSGKPLSFPIISSNMSPDLSSKVPKRDMVPACPAMHHGFCYFLKSVHK